MGYTWTTVGTSHSHQTERRLKKLNERLFWRAAFLAAEFPLLIDKRRVGPSGLAHLAAEYADAAVLEYRRRHK